MGYQAILVKHGICVFFQHMEFALFCDVYCRFQIADALKMDVESSIFKQVLSHFENDDDWNPDIPMEAIWLKMKEKRYKLEGLKGLVKHDEKELEKEVMEKETSSSSSGSNLLSLANVPEIKVENEKWAKLQARLKVAKSGKSLLAYSLNTI